MQPEFLPSVAALADRYNGFILDLWGVIHDGTHLYPGVKECLEKLRAQQKKIVFLSNAPRRASMVQAALEKMGITESLYDRIITSGEAAYQSFAAPQHNYGKAYFYIGLEKDRSLLKDLPHYTEVATPLAADFVLLAHTYIDNQPMEELRPLLERAYSKNLPVVCINPDKEVVRLTGEEVYCAGVIAAEYERMGGKAIYFGKPHQAVYEICYEVLAGVEKSAIIAVGDNLITDIAGAHRAGIASAWVTGGVAKRIVGTPESAAYHSECAALLAYEAAAPDYIIPVFSW